MFFFTCSVGILRDMYRSFAYLADPILTKGKRKIALSLFRNQDHEEDDFCH